MSVVQDRVTSKDTPASALRRCARRSPMPTGRHLMNPRIPATLRQPRLLDLHARDRASLLGRSRAPSAPDSVQCEQGVQATLPRTVAARRVHPLVPMTIEQSAQDRFAAANGLVAC